jgi:hypothetical protein
MARRLNPFEYFDPRSVKEAVSTLFRWGSTGLVLVGGVALVGDMGGALRENTDHSR